MRIAVIGSGIAGLAAAWYASQRHDVVVYERSPSPGMGAFAVDVAPGHIVDVPLRVFYAGYYPTLTALYRAVGVKMAQANYASSFSRLGGDTYFRYRNWIVGGRSLPWVHPRVLSRRSARRILWDLGRLYATARRDLEGGIAPDMTLSAYVAARGYSDVFVEDFLLPAFAGICTCSYRRLEAYPAHTIIDYMTRGIMSQGVSRAVGGSRDVVSQLLAACEDVRNATPVVRVHPDGDGVLVTEGGGHVDRFDHAVVATQANQAAPMLAADDPVAPWLADIPYESSRVVVHRDPRLMPADRDRWSSVNFIVAAGTTAPMATIWMNGVQGELAAHPDVFQTWNPIVEPAESSVVTDVSFERPVVDLRSERAVHAIQTLQGPGAPTRIRVCGSYAERGIPLLESAARSAKRAVDAIGA